MWDELTQNWRQLEAQTLAEIAEGVPEELEPPLCPACHSGYGTYLGQLGKLAWFRCRGCGMDFNVRGETTHIPDDLD